MVKSFEELIVLARKKAPKRCVVVCAEDETVLEGIKMAFELNLIKPVLVGNADRIATHAHNVGLNPEAAEIHDVPDDEAMKQAVQTSPLTLGYGFSTWSAARLAAHLAKITGIRFSDDQLGRLLHEHGFSIHRPKHPLKGKRDEGQYAKAKKQLAGLKKKR